MKTSKLGLVKKEEKKAESNIKIEPVIQVNVPAPDMNPIAMAIEKMISEPVAPKVDVHVHEKEKKPKKIKIEVTERDERGRIKTLICEDITDNIINT